MIKKDKTTQNIIRGIMAILTFFILTSIETLPFDLLKLNLDYVPTVIKSLYMGIYEILILSIIAMIYSDLLIEKWKDFKKNNKEYFNHYFKYWFLLLGLMMISNLVIMAITKDTSGADNQKQIVDTLSKAPIYTYIAAVFFAPAIEELVFRQSIRNLIPKDNVLFIISSGVIFGAMHVLGATSLAQWLYIIPYSIPGLIFAYILTKTDNIFCTMGLHFVHNGVLMALQIFVLIFG